MSCAKHDQCDHDLPAEGKTQRKAVAFVVESDPVFDWPVTDAELTAIERLLGDDLARLLRGSDRN